MPIWKNKVACLLLGFGLLTTSSGSAQGSIGNAKYVLAAKRRALFYLYLKRKQGGVHY